jgi:hypothetical protein
MTVVDVGLVPSLADRRAGLQELLGSGFQVGEGGVAPAGIVVLNEASITTIGDTRAKAREAGIIVLLEEHDEVNPRSIVALIEAGADVCLVAPGTAGLAAHIRALAAHRPGAVVSPPTCLT